MANKDYNMESTQGITDMDYVERLGLDPSLAGTPKINEAILKATRDVEYQSFIDSGMTEPEARAKAQASYQHGMKNVKANLAKRKA